jgi:hypothetical protein
VKEFPEKPEGCIKRWIVITAAIHNDFGLYSGPELTMMDLPKDITVFPT